MAAPQKPGKNNYILAVFDSCRYDSFEATRPKTISEAWQNRAALVLCFVDCSLALQSAYRAIATLFAGERICIRLLQTGLPEILGKTWSRSHGFDSYNLMEHHNDMRAMVKEMTFSADQ